MCAFLSQKYIRTKINIIQNLIYVPSSKLGQELGCMNSHCFMAEKVSFMENDRPKKSAPSNYYCPLFKYLKKKLIQLWIKDLISIKLSTLCNDQSWKWAPTELDYACRREFSMQWGPLWWMPPLTVALSQVSYTHRATLLSVPNRESRIPSWAVLEGEVMSFPLERRQEKCEGVKDNELGMGMTHHPQNTCIRYGMSVSCLPGIEYRVRSLDLGPTTTYKIMYKLNPTYFRTISHVSVANRGLI